MRSALRKLMTQPKVSLFLVFVAALAVLACVQPPDVFADPDSFYHAELTVMLRDQGLVRDFPWTTASFYRDTFIDHHLGYHLLALPLVSLWDEPLVGLRVATVLFAALSVLACVYVLKRWSVPWWGVGLVLLITSAPFVFRISLAKAPSLAIGVAVIGYLLVTERKIGWLFWYGWFWAWFYSSWPLLIVMTLVLIGVEAFPAYRKGIKVVWRRIIAKENLKLVGAVAGGIVTGLIVNPYFPTNFVYLKQLLGMALIPYQNFVAIGGEWYPYSSPFELPSYLAYPILAWIVACVAAAFTVRRQTHLSRTTWLMAIFFLAYTLRAKRQVEYLAPWLVLSSGLIFRDAGLGKLKWDELKDKLKTWIPNWAKRRSVVIILGAYLLVVVPWGLIRGVTNAKQGLQQGFTLSSMVGSAEWLSQHSRPGDIVFQSDWGTFPMLWYHNRKNFYLTGLDQTFMYEYDHQKYSDWYSVVKGERHDVAQVAGNEFGARYVLVEKRTPAMLVWANRDKDLKKVHEDVEAIIYEVNIN